MKNRIICCCLALVCVLALETLRPDAATASTTTTLLSESFSSTSFPPAGWTVGPRNYGTSQPCSYASQPGWYRSTGNPGGVAGVGSAVCWTFGAYSQNCYGSPTYGPCTMTTPNMNLSGITVSGDSQYVDFDIYIAASYYDYNSASYSNYMGHVIEVANGTTVLKTFKAYGSSGGDWTVYTGRSGLCLSDPSSYNSTIYWKHVHMPLGSLTGNLQLTFRVKMLASGCRYSYWYSENVAITNVKVTSTHYDMLTVNGPGSLDFGRIPYQTPSIVKYTTFTNNSSRVINLSNVLISGAQAADYSIVYVPSSVAIGTSDSIGIVFSPQGSGGRLATLTLNTDADLPRSVSVALSGYGLQPSIALPQNLPPLFSQRRVRFGDSLTATLLIRNSGEVPLHVYPASSGFTGDHPEFYRVAQWPSPAIAGGATDSIVLSFTPYIEGTMLAQFNVGSDANNGTQTVTLRGIGILPHLVVTTNTTTAGASDPSTVAFGQVAIGDSTCQTISLHNPGSDTLFLQKQIVTYGDYDFTFQTLTGTDQYLAPDQTKLVNVCFKPLQRGIRMASLRLYTNISTMYPSGGDSSQYLIQVTGNGVPYGALTVSGELNDTAIVNQTNCITDTLWNTGAADLTVSSVKLSGTNASDFGLSGATFPLIVSAGKFQTLKLCYSPTVRGLSNAMLDIVASSSDRNLNQSLALLGVGQEVCMDATPNPVGFGSAAYPAMTLAVTGHDTASITVKNCGDRPMLFAAMLDSTSSTAYSLITTSTATIAPQATGTISIAYDPDTLGASGGSVKITPSEASLAPITLPLSGQGAGVIVAATGQAVSTDVNSSSTFTVTLNNTGNIAWTPGTAEVTGADYSLPSTTVTPASIAPGQSGTISVTFAPMQAGTRTGTLTFSNAQPAPFNVGALPYNLSAQATTSAGVAMRSEQDGYSIAAVYPNPVANQASIDVTVPRASQVAVALVRVDGSEIARIYSGPLTAGEHTLTLDTKSIPSGKYFCVLSKGSVKVMREIVVLK